MGEPSSFRVYLGAVTELINVTHIPDREEVHHKVQRLLDYIEQNWLVEAETHEIVKSST